MYKILIADDEAIEREALGYFIKKSNLEIGEIIECVNGTEVVKKVMLERPDIILLDINMPGLTGLEAMEHIRKMNYKCKVIFLTAYDYFEYAIKAIQLGAMDFRVKPVNEENLITVLTKAIDFLDEEHKKYSQNEKFKEFASYMENGIVGKLILGNFNEEVLYYLDTLGVNAECEGNCYCIKILSEIIEDNKQILISKIRQEFSLLELKIIINLKNQMLTIVLFQGFENKDKITYLYVEEILVAVLKQLNYKFIIGTGLTFKEIDQIEQSYSHARSIVGDVNKIKEENKILSSVEENEIPVEIQGICNFIEENYSNKMTLDDIAAHSGFSKYYICRLFKQYKEFTIVEYLIHVRINKAKQLLKNEKYSIKQISDMVGYSNPDYFTWAFKKVEKVSPIKYRYSE